MSGQIKRKWEPQTSGYFPAIPGIRMHAVGVGAVERTFSIQQKARDVLAGFCREKQALQFRSHLLS